MSKSGIAVTLAIGLLASSGVAVTAQETSPTLVTEEVEPGVERIISDGAGHDLDETHPTFRYDMDSIFITPDGTVWLSTTYSRSDNDANPPGALVWALGQPGTSQAPDGGPFCGTNGTGVTCFDMETETETTYLAGTPINQVAMAPDGTVWAVGGHAGENGGLYRITPE